MTGVKLTKVLISPSLGLSTPSHLHSRRRFEDAALWVRQDTILHINSEELTCLDVKVREN